MIKLLTLTVVSVISDQRKVVYEPITTYSRFKLYLRFDFCFAETKSQEKETICIGPYQKFLNYDLPLQSGYIVLSEAFAFLLDCSSCCDV